MLDEGAGLIELALQIRRKFFGNDHPATALSLNSFPGYNASAATMKAATIAVQDALRINRKVYGERGLPVAVSLEGAGTRATVARPVHRRARLRERGPRDSETNRLVRNRPEYDAAAGCAGPCATRAQELDAAEETYKTLLPLDQKQLGTRKHPKYATHLANFGLVLEQTGQACRRGPRAIRTPSICMPIRWIGIATRTSSTPTPTWARCYGRCPSRPRTPASTCKRRWTWVVQIRGESHVLVGNDYANPARWHYDTGARDGATKGFARALAIYASNVRKRALPADHFFIAEALTWQGRIAVERDTPAGGKEGEPLLRKALEIWPAQLGPNSPGESLSQAYLGRALGLQRER